MYKNHLGKKINVYKNPWIRYIAHKLRVLDINLSTMYYDRVGHKSGVKCMTDPQTTINNAEEAAHEVTRMMHKIMDSHFKDASYLPDGKFDLFKDSLRVKDRVNKSKRARKYNWRKHLKRNRHEKVY